MAVEIERKFLVNGGSWLEGSHTNSLIRQGYLFDEPAKSLRVRVKGDLAFLTIKTGKGPMVRGEFEYAIPLDDGIELLARHCVGGVILKTRHNVTDIFGQEWEIDVFDSALTGLVLAEIELPTSSTPIVEPPWLGREVTADARFLNSNLRNVRCVADIGL